MRRPLDAELVRRGLATSRDHARELVGERRVLVGGAQAEKETRLVAPAESVVVKNLPPRFVGRGGEKLSAALDVFDLDPSGLRVLDAGASTGGFTDCLLQAGAASVVALDVGYGQIHDRLRRDPRVQVVERTNIRHVGPDDFGIFDAVVSDLSFISLTKVMDALVSCCGTGGWLVLLVKPQFEVSREVADLGRGVVKDPEQWRNALERVVCSAEGAEAELRGLAPSPLKGAEGNVEFLLHLEKIAVSSADNLTKWDQAGGLECGSAIEAAIESVTPVDLGSVGSR